MNLPRSTGRLLLACLLAVTILVAPAAAQPAAEPQHVWWEGERPAATNFPPRSSFSAENYEGAKALLSGGAWLSSDGPRRGDELFARYEVQVPAAGAYELWTRKFWKHGPFRWRFGDHEWRICGRDVALADDTVLAKHVDANWVWLGRVELPAGAQTFELRLLANEGEPTTAAFDCFLLTTGMFVPRGKLRPGERWGRADEGSFAWEPDLDTFAAEALLDLRQRNEAEAGAAGFVRRDRDQFRLGGAGGAGGAPVHFFGVNVTAENAGQSPASVEYLARKLAKLGVNLVRYHAPLFAAHGDPARLDQKRLDDLFRLVAALKRQGIYTAISTYYPVWVELDARWGIEGYEGRGRHPFALIFFQPRLQELWRGWCKQLLTTENPYTGVPLARDPAVAMVEVVNEDSLFFWTFTKEQVPEPHWRALEARFGKWLRQSKPVELREAWHMTADGRKAAGAAGQKRIDEQVRFLAEVQRGFYEEAAAYLKQQLGYGGLVVCGNWHVTDPVLLDLVERHTYTAGDVMDRHAYFQGKHEGERSGFAVAVGQTVEDRAAVREPAGFPLAFPHIDGWPNIMSEVGWPSPNRFRGDAMFLSAVEASERGVDGVTFFVVESNLLADQAMTKFGLGTPVLVGAMPAAALLYRRGDVTSPKQVAWDAKKGLVTVDTPRAQGAAGFLAQAGQLRLGDVQLRCENEFASVLVVSLDDRPLRESGSVLVQAVTEDAPFGFRRSGEKISDMGGPPFGMREVRATVALRIGGGNFEVVALDENGTPRADAPVKHRRQGSMLEIELRRDAIHHVVRRR